MSNALANGLAGAGAGIIAQILTYPLQTVNTRQQTERIAKKKVLGGGEPSATATVGATPPSSGGTLLFQILQQVIRTEGWGGLYSGLKPSLVGTAASQGIYYYFYQVFKNKAEAAAIARKKRGLGDGTVGMFSWLVVAAIAGSVNVLLTNPIWVLVTRMQTHTQAEKKIMEAKREAILREASDRNDLPSFEDNLAKIDSIKPRPYGTVHAAWILERIPSLGKLCAIKDEASKFPRILNWYDYRSVGENEIMENIYEAKEVQEVYREAGLKGFWKGIIPTLIMVCNPSIQFMIYETSLKNLKARRAANKSGNKNVTALEVFLLGALAKLGATVSTYPLLVVKSRLQAKQEIGGNVKLRYTGTMDAIMKMIRYEGFPGFYKGMSTKILQSVFAASVLFMVKEELVKAYLVLSDGSRKIIL